MWLSLNDAFVSIVAKDCARDEVLVRARRKGDIEKLFPGIKAIRTPGGDYLWRAAVKRSVVGEMLVGEVARITYDNFKNSVQDARLHDAYLQCWIAMEQLQPRRRKQGSLGL